MEAGIGVSIVDIEIRRVEWFNGGLFAEILSTAARNLILALEAEMLQIYPGDEATDHFMLGADEVAVGRGVFMIAYSETTPVACGAIRLLNPDTAELKRMYVIPQARGQGIAGRLLDVLESEARRLGARKAVLVTGPRQPEAISLYSRAGFVEIEGFGKFKDHPLGYFMGKQL